MKKRTAVLLMLVTLAIAFATSYFDFFGRLGQHAGLVDEDLPRVRQGAGGLVIELPEEGE